MLPGNGLEGGKRGNSIEQKEFPSFWFEPCCCLAAAPQQQESDAAGERFM
jgi:hypothetical protein